MAEISNATLALLVLAALVVVIAGTVLNFTSIGSSAFGPTGFAQSDTGYVNLTINTTLAIQVNASFNTINFGGCAPRPGVSYWCATNDSIECDNGANNLGNCTGDTTTPQYIEIDNVGNVDANITLQAECTAAQLIGGTGPAFTYITTMCNGTNVTAWTAFSGAAGQAACTNLSYTAGTLRLYANVTIPNNAVGGSGGCAGQSDVTFTATQAT